jgi:hypothetical protein
MPNTSVTIEVVSIQTSTDSGKPVCDTRLRKDMAGSLERLRVFKACRLDADFPSLVSDENGDAALTNFPIRSGPEGTYNFRFVLPNKIYSRTITTFFETPASKIEVLTLPILSAIYGVPLSSQPTVRVLDGLGNPLPNKKVIAISWSEYGLTATDAFPFNLRGMNVMKCFS